MNKKITYLLLTLSLIVLILVGCDKALDPRIGTSFDEFRNLYKQKYGFLYVPVPVYSDKNMEIYPHSPDGKAPFYYFQNEQLFKIDQKFFNPTPIVRPKQKKKSSLPKMD